MRTTKAHQPLTSEQQRLVAQHYPGLILWVARRYYGNTVPEDAVSAGAQGLVIAASRFSPARGLQFNTYAHHWVRALILEQLVRERGPVRYGTTMAQRRVIFNLGKARKVVGDDLGDIAAHLRVDRAIVEETVVRLGNKDVAIDARDDEHRPFDLADEGAGPEALFGEGEERDGEAARLRVAVGRLDERERRIVRARHLAARPRTLACLGVELNLSRERVRQIEARAMGKLRRMLKAA